MKLSSIAKNEVQTIGEVEDIEFGIDMEDEWIIYKSFTNYSDPISSIVRELTSNAFDAHIEAGTKEPVIVKITESNAFDGTPTSLSIIDKGTGLSPEAIRTVYSRFGKSSKRHTNDLIGGYGFGAKSPLAYQDMFELITTVDGIKYYYSIHNGERKPTINLLHQHETEDPNGTEVRVVIKTGDLFEFKKAIKSSLLYFENIKYVNCGVDNDYNIVKGKNFIYSTNSKDIESVHLCIGKVYYPLDTDKVGISWRESLIPIGLYFNFGEIPVVWNRESVEYTKEAVEKIKEKFEDAREELQEIYNKSYNSDSSIEAFLRNQPVNSIPLYRDEDKNIEIPIPNYSNFIKFINRHPGYKYLNVTPSKDLLIQFNIACLYRTGYKYFPHTEDNLYIIQPNKKMSTVYNDYLKETLDSFRVVRLINRRQAIKYILKELYSPLFITSPYTVAKENRQKLVEEAHRFYDEILEYVTKYSKEYDASEIPDEWIKNYQEEQDRIKKERNELISVHSVTLEYSFSRYYLGASKIKHSYKQASLVVYGFQRDREALINAKQFIHKEYSHSVNMLRIEVIQIAMKNEKYFKESLGDKLVHVSKFKDLPIVKRVYKNLSLHKWVLNLNKEGAFNELLNVNRRIYQLVGSKYIDPAYADNIEEPSPSDKDKVYKIVGEYLKYPMITHLGTLPKQEIIDEYKRSCKHHNINPILLGKLYLKPYESLRIQNERSSDSDTGE